ncbi:subtilisin-like protease 4 [Musa acuminata AAA Group]|uniref:subtilisin-like protease 4 n=1 Tax=Musa acuminata AAA Group TaxID=214697 RepID=UPI0031E17B04
MEIVHPLPMCLSLFAFVSFFSYPCIVSCSENPHRNTNQLQTYVIQLETPTASLDADGLNIWHKSFLPVSDDDSDRRLVHSYSQVFSGFAARLTEEEAKSVAKKEGFLRVYPDSVLPLLTTHTPGFLGLQSGGGTWRAASFGKGIIIGLLDSGLDHDHPSFHDDGVPPPPTKWKGTCGFKTGCNNKLIGAKNLLGGSSPDGPIDADGHGTHTASTAAGNFLNNASYYGLAGGTAAGIAPHAHLAIYKVCITGRCQLSDVLAGIDAAVGDGVDVISISIGGDGTPLDYDLLAIGAFGAVKKGIFVSCAGGNSGPGERTVANEAPWLLTVAASTVDRSQRATVKLGDGQKFNGESLDQYPTSSGSLLTLFHMYTDPYCKSLNSSQVEGKVVACLVYRTPNYTATLVKAAGGVGVILISTEIEGYTILDNRCNFPAAIVSNEDGDRITSYATLATKPTVSITYDGTIIGSSPAPVVASFSSRGPSINVPGILKPDVSGPGVNILAAWPSDVVGGDGRMGRMTFNFESGTSMATPHLSGVAALLKSLHPCWSPAAIKSAIITTSDDKDGDGNQIMDQQHTTAGFFAMGAGHVNPSKAADPGLVYDLGIDDYIAYACGKFGNKGVRDIVRDTTVDCGKINNITESELNYPSIVVAPKNGTAATVKRTVTNVGQAKSSYTVEVEVPETVSVTVRPPSLSFSEVNQKMSFLVTAKWTTAGLPTRNAEGNLKWVSGKRVVRSPLVVSIL